MNNFCTMPFNSLEVSPDGTVKVCCKIDKDLEKTSKIKFNVLNDKIEEIWNSDDLNNLRQQFINNEKPIDCNKCWIEESSGLKSLRLQTINQVYDLRKPKISYLSLKLSNKCNLACRICNPTLSSVWQNHFDKLNLELTPEHTFKTIKLEKFTGDNLQSLHEASSNLQHLLLYGGEPLINEEVLNYLTYLVDNKISSQIILTLNTNGTVYSDELIDQFKKFKRVNLFLSIDDVDKRFEYQRWPAKWSKIESNLKKYSALNDNIHVKFYPSISILNITDLGETLDKLSSYGIPITFNNIIHEPKILSIRNLPIKLKIKIISYLESLNFDSFLLDKGYENPKEALINFINLDNEFELDLSEENYLNKIVNYLDIHDNFRGTKLSEYIPNLWNNINEK